MSLAGCIIRTAVIDEIRRVEDCCVDAYRQYRGHITPGLYHAYLKDLRSLGTYWHEAEVLVADTSGEIAGSVQFYADASTEGLGLPSRWAGFRKLAVRPSARGQSIGRMLVGKCIERAAVGRATTIGIHTASFMEAACHLYEKMGFRRCPEFDLAASALPGVGSAGDGLKLIGYRLDLR